MCTNIYFITITWVPSPHEHCLQLVPYTGGAGASDRLLDDVISCPPSMVLILLMVPSVIIADGLGDGRRLDMGVDSDIPYIGCSMSGSSGSSPSFSIGPPGMG